MLCVLFSFNVFDLIDDQPHPLAGAIRSPRFNLADKFRKDKPHTFREIVE